MHPPRKLLSTVIATVLLCGAAAAAEPVMKHDGILVNNAGMTVYTFDADTDPGKSACNGGCAENWPAVPAPAELAPPYAAITRDDGNKQLTYKGKPLYTFKKDIKAGDRMGDGFKNVWHIVKD